MKHIVFSFLLIDLLLCSCSRNKASQNQPTYISAEMAYEGVNNYCHSAYDWGIAENNPSIMYVEKGDETESEYKVKFRSYTGSFVYFNVDKTSGVTRMVECVQALGIESDAGTINIFDYLENRQSN